jgi:hypothetical protein
MSNVFLDRIEAVLTGLPTDAPLHDVYDALSDFAEEDVAAVLATRSLTAGGGGGSELVGDPDATVQGEDDPAGDGGDVTIRGGDGDVGSGTGGSVTIRGGTGDSNGVVNLQGTVFTGALTVDGSIAATGGITSTGTVDGELLGEGFDYVAVIHDPPDASFSRPLLYDDTAVTGGLYAWDGTAYVKVSNVVA